MDRCQLNFRYRLALKMVRSTLLVLTIALSVNVQCLWAQTGQQPQKVRRVKRVKRPTFDKSKTKTLYFEDVYADAIVGVRPNRAQLAALKGSSNADETDLSLAETQKATIVGWSALVDASAIEDEVKTQQQQISRLITTPVVFQTKYGDVHQSFEVLSTLFAVIRQYDDDIRWRKQSPVAQMLFQKAAVSSRTGSATGFRFCKLRKDDLQEIVRGGSISASQKPPEKISWQDAADRSALMERLEIANENLKTYVANENEFKASIGEINQEANMIALMARVIVLDGMPEADEDQYTVFGKLMEEAAVELKSAVKAVDFEKASTARNLLGRSCDDCHAQWR